MGHGHHHHVDPESGDGKVAAAVGINIVLTVAQVIGGIVAGSLSLIADALHNFSDAIDHRLCCAQDRSPPGRCANDLWLWQD